MATTRLNAGVTARCPEGRMTVGWKADGLAAGGMLLEVVKVSDPATAALGTSPLGPTQTLIAGLPEAVAILVRPAFGSTFAHDAHVELALTLRVDNVEAGQYLLPRVNVSGTPSTTLAVLSPNPGFWQIDVPASLGGPPMIVGSDPAGGSLPVESELEGLARSAAFAARRSAGATRVAAPRELHVAVDRSASFLPLVRQGSGQALLELVLGVNEVAGSEAQVGLWTMGNVPQQVRPSLTKSNLNGYWSTAFGDQAHTGGTLVAPLIAQTNSNARDRTVIILTDGAPADAEDVATAVAEARAEGTRTTWHLLALARSSADPHVRQEPWRDELATLAPLARAGVLSYSAISPSAEASWLTDRLQDQDVMHQIVDQLPLWGHR